MSMTRAQLAQMIGAGRSSALNCLTMLKDVHAESKDIGTDDAVGKLFQTSFMNDCIFLKTVEATQVSDSVQYAVDTLLYFPFNYDNIYEGGNSILMSDPGLKSKLSVKFGSNISSPDVQEKFEADQVIMNLIGSIATFDPFLFKCKAQQLSLEERIHPSFFNVDEREWSILQTKIRSKIRALVERAFEGVEVEDKSLIEKQVTIFLNKIWEARDVEGIEDLVTSLDIAHDKAPDLFFAWKAICYYQTKYEFLKPSLREFLSWFGATNTALPSDFAVLPREQQEYIKRTLTALRARLRQNYLDTEAVLTDYEDGYRKFIEGGNPEGFKDFLGKADLHCDSLAAGLASFAHGINILADVTSKWGTRMQNRQHAELLDAFTNLFGAGSAKKAPVQNNETPAGGLIGVTADSAVF